MVAPLIAAVPAISGLVGTIMSNNADKKAQQQAQQIAEENLGYQKELNDKLFNATKEQNDFQRAIAQQLLSMAQGGSSDVSGNRTRFNPETNSWEVVATPTTKAIQSQTDQQNLQRLIAQQMMTKQNLARQGREGQVADAQLSEIENFRPRSEQSIRDALLKSRTTETNDAFDKVQGKVGRQAVRSGASNAGNIIASIAQQRAKALRNETGDIDLRAMEAADSLNSSKQTNMANLYSNMANRAINPASITPVQSLTETLAQRANAGTTTSLYAGQQFKGEQPFRAATVPQNSYNPVSTGKGTEKTANGIGNILGGLISAGKLF